MSEQAISAQAEKTVNAPKAPDQLSDILLVLDKEKKRIEAVKGIDKEGKLETVPVDKKHQSQFMRVDKHGDIFSNFVSNFWRQLKDPTRFDFFKVPVAEALQTAKKMQQHVDAPTKEGEQLMDKHQVKTDPKQLSSNDPATTQATGQEGDHRYDMAKIDWETMTNLGLSKEKLEKENVLDGLLRGYKSEKLLPLSVNLGGVIIRTEARLSLQQTFDGAVVVAVHGVRKEPNLHFPFFGHEFTKEDKENLLRNGNMGRVVNLTHQKTGEPIPSIISIDRLTNEVIALRTDKIKIPDEIKGVRLSDEQKQTLQEGKPLHLQGMISKKGEPFDATVQFNADKRYVEFLFDRSNANKQSQATGQSQPGEAPKTFRGKELDDQQYQKYKEGQYVFIDGLVDKKGEKYQGYVRFNKETGKQQFDFKNPDKLKEKVQPAESHKTQVAVNSDGKTNEATKNIKEPLKSAQAQPDSAKQQQEQEQEPAKTHKIKR